MQVLPSCSKLHSDVYGKFFYKISESRYQTPCNLLQTTDHSSDHFCGGTMLHNTSSITRWWRHAFYARCELRCFYARVATNSVTRGLYHHDDTHLFHSSGVFIIIIINSSMPQLHLVILHAELFWLYKVVQILPRLIVNYSLKLWFKNGLKKISPVNIRTTLYIKKCPSLCHFTLLRAFLIPALL